jgi:hypothetical protein
MDTSFTDHGIEQVVDSSVQCLFTSWLHNFHKDASTETYNGKSSILLPLELHLFLENDSVLCIILYLFCMCFQHDACKYIQPTKSAPNGHNLYYYDWIILVINTYNIYKLGKCSCNTILWHDLNILDGSKKTEKQYILSWVYFGNRYFIHRPWNWTGGGLIRI